MWRYDNRALTLGDDFSININPPDYHFDIGTNISGSWKAVAETVVAKLLAYSAGEYNFTGKCSNGIFEGHFFNNSPYSGTRALVGRYSVGWRMIGFYHDNIPADNALTNMHTYLYTATEQSS